MSSLLRFFNIIDMKGEIALKALTSNFNDFEDAMQYYAVINYGNIDFIITRNKKNFANSKIEVLSPDEFLGRKS